MAQPTNTFDSYDAVGNREDLIDAIYDISPTETPFMSMIADRGTASAVLHEWQSDALAAASSSNALIEGDDASGASLNPTTRLNNRCQISGKTVVISGTQETVNKAGRGSEVGYQVAKVANELKRDMETILTGNQAPVTGNSTTARALRSLESWYATNVSRGAGGANGSTSAAATDGTQRDFTEDLLKDVVQKCWAAGGNPDVIMVGPKNKQKLSAFAGNSTRTKDADDKKLVAAIDIYESDFGALKVVPNRFSRERTAHVLESGMVEVSFLRDFFLKDLAVTGDSTKKQLLAEYTLQMNNEAAHGVIADLTTT
jgi:hypothetical protein